MRTAVAIAAMLVALAFAMSVFERWLLRRREHELAWSFALLLFAVAAGALAVGAGLGWDGTSFRIFYLFGAILDVPFLAVGTVYLLRPGWGRGFAMGVGLAGAFAVGVVVTAPFHAALPADRLVQGSAVFGVLPRVLAAVGSGAGATVVLGGAVYSIVRGRGAISNGLIGAATLILAASGLLNSVFDAMTAFAVTLLVGVCALFAGFLLAVSAPPAPRALTSGPAAAASLSLPSVEARRRT